MTSDLRSSGSTAARIERALVLLAYCIELDGDVHVPLYERLETDLETITRTEDTKARARRLLSHYSRSNDVAAISSTNKTFASLHISNIS